MNLLPKITLAYSFLVHLVFSQETKLRNFSILKAGVSLPDKQTHRFYMGAYLELDIDTSQPVFTLQFGLIKSYKLYLIRLKGLFDDLLPQTPKPWLSSLPDETKSAVLTRLKSISSIPNHRVITAINYPSSKIESFPLFLLNCQSNSPDASNDSKNKNINLQLNKAVENKMFTLLVNQNRLGFSIFLRNLHMYKMRATDEKYYQIHTNDLKFNYSTYSSFDFMIYFEKNENLNKLKNLNPIKLLAHSQKSETIIFNKSETGNTENSYLSKIGGAIEDSLTSIVPTLNGRTNFKIPTLDKYVPISNSGILESFAGFNVNKKYENKEYKLNGWDELMNEIYDKREVREETSELNVSETDGVIVKVLREINDVEGIKNKVKGVKFELEKEDENQPEIVDRGSSNAWEWVVGIIVAFLVIGIVAVVVWFKVAKSKLRYEDDLKI